MQSHGYLAAVDRSIWFLLTIWCLARLFRCRNKDGCRALFSALSLVTGMLVVRYRNVGCLVCVAFRHLTQASPAFLPLTVLLMKTAIACRTHWKMALCHRSKRRPLDHSSFLSLLLQNELPGWYVQDRSVHQRPQHARLQSGPGVGWHAAVSRTEAGLRSGEFSSDPRLLINLSHHVLCWKDWRCDTVSNLLLIYHITVLSKPRKLICCMLLERLKKYDIAIQYDKTKIYD